MSIIPPLTWYLPESTISFQKKLQPMFDDIHQKLDTLTHTIKKISIIIFQKLSKSLSISGQYLLQKMLLINHYTLLVLTPIVSYLKELPVKYPLSVFSSFPYTILALSTSTSPQLFLILVLAPPLAFVAVGLLIGIHHGLEAIDHRFNHRMEGEHHPGLNRTTIERDGMIIHRENFFPQLNQTLIDEGARCIVNEVLRGADPATLAAFREYDPAMYMYVTTKLIFLYTLGNKINAPIPPFLKDNTQVGIRIFRDEHHLPRFDLLQLQRLLATPTQFEANIEASPTKDILNRLKSIASEELQGSQFLTRSWPRACELLPATH